MPDRRRVPLPFGEGLDRETGVMAVRPVRMDDLRNVYFRRGKLVVRRGLEQKLSFQDSAGNPATHVLAGQSLSSERSGVVVAYEQANTGEVNVYQIDADATVGDRIGTWFTQDVGAEPPIVITAESYGRAFFAHDELRDPQREQTVVYDPRRGNTLQPLTADLRGEGDEAVRFRGVVRHLEYIFGYGFGTEGEDRPELVRASLPGAPQEFRPEHYWIVGDRRDPVMGVYRAGRSALVFKEAETYVIQGSGRDDFERHPLDTLHGILAPRLAVTVGDAVYGWSAEGPRRWRGDAKGSVDLALPLDLEGFEPTDLVDRGNLRQGFAHYIPAERLVVFVFGQRVYALSIRQPDRPEWTYFELGVTPRCAFTLRAHGPGTGAESQTAPTGHPEYLDNVTPRAADELRPQWKNVGQDGDERVNIWTRRLNQLAEDWELDTDGGGGVAEGWTFTAEAGITATPSIAEGGQKIEVTASTGAGMAYVERQDVTREPVVAGEEYGISISHEVANLVATGDARLIYRWFDNSPSQIGSDQVLDPTEQPAEFERELTVEATAPAGAVRLDVLLAFNCAAGGDTGDVIFRDLAVDPTADRAAWEEQGAFLVATDTTQEQLIDGFAEETLFEIALRYKRSVFFTSGYESADPSTWPQESRGVAATRFADVDTPTIEETWYTVWRDSSTGEFNIAFDMNVAISQDTYDRLEEAEAAGFSWEMQLWEKVASYDDGDGTTRSDSSFQEASGALADLNNDLEDFVPERGDPLGARMIAQPSLRDSFLSAQEFEYFVRLTIESEIGDLVVDSETVSLWPGRYDAPTELRTDEPTSFPPPSFDYEQASGEGGASTIETVLQYAMDPEFRDEIYGGEVNDELGITSLIPNRPPDENTEEFRGHVRVQWRNVTQGGTFAALTSTHSGAAGYLDGGAVPLTDGGASPSIKLTAATSGETYAFRVKMSTQLSTDMNIRDRRFETDWSDPVEVVAP